MVGPVPGTCILPINGTPRATRVKADIWTAPGRRAAVFITASRNWNCTREQNGGSNETPTHFPPQRVSCYDTNYEDRHALLAGSCASNCHSVNAFHRKASRDMSVHLHRVAVETQNRVERGNLRMDRLPGAPSKVAECALRVPKKQSRTSGPHSRPATSGLRLSQSRNLRERCLCARLSSARACARHQASRRASRPCPPP